MSSFRRERSTALAKAGVERVFSNTGKRPERSDQYESERLSSDRVRKLLGEGCTLTDAQIEELTDGLCALAEFTVTAFVEQRRQRKTVASDQPMPTYDGSTCTQDTA